MAQNVSDELSLFSVGPLAHIEGTVANAKKLIILRYIPSAGRYSVTS